jgi:hypothetical protein
MKRWLYENSLSVVLLLIWLGLLGGESIAGDLQHNEELTSHNDPTLSYAHYLGSGAFIESVFENWESEFLQMGAYIILTVSLRQKGSAESKKLIGQQKTDQQPKKSASPDAPWPVRKGGFILKVYENSLSLAFLLLFLISFGLHAYGGARDACQQNLQHHETCISTASFVTTSDFWFQSLQNWQSEFLAFFSIVVLTIFLRQKGSPESKPVNSPYSETGSD